MASVRSISTFNFPKEESKNFQDLGVRRDKSIKTYRRKSEEKSPPA